jgi:choice-of-anchor B domain-containing protein
MHWMNRAIKSARMPLSLVVVAGSLAGVPTARADEDGKKLRDKLPAVRANALTGKVRSPSNGQIPDAPFQSDKVALLAWLPLNSFSTNPASAADCWGYVSPSGREYALMGVSGGTAYVEVTNPTSPTIVKITPGPVSLWQDVAVIGHYAYSVSEGGQGIRVDDMSQIDAGIVTKIQNKMQLGHSSSHTILQNTDSGYLYLCGTNINNGGLTAVNTTNPADPIIVGAWNTRYVHEAQIISYTSGPYAGKEIAFLFTGGPVFYGFGLDIVDVTNKSNITTLSSYQYPLTGFAHQGWATPDLKYMYIDDEGDEYGGLVNQLTTRVIDIGNLANPIQVGTFSNGRKSIDHNQYVKGKYLYQANYRSGLAVFDTTNKISPTQVAWFDTFPADDNPSFNSLWGNYPYLPSGIVIGSDIEQGMFIWQVGVGALKFSYPGGVPTALAAGAPTALVVKIAEEDATLKPASVTLHAAINGTNFQAYPASPIGGNQFTANLPAASAGDTVNFYYAAQAGDLRNFADPATAPTAYYSAVVDGGCYPDCDASGTLDIDDFICFQTFFAIGDPYADCDASGTLDIDDFICFQTFFAIGC